MRKLIKKKLKYLEPLKQYSPITEKINPFYDKYLDYHNIDYSNLNQMNEVQRKLNLNYDVMVLNLNSNLNTGAIYRSGCLLGMDQYIIAGKKIYNVRSMVGYKFCPLQYLDIFPKMRNRMIPKTLSNFDTIKLINFLSNKYHIYLVEQGGRDITTIDFEISKKIYSKKKILYIFGNETFGIPKNMISLLKEKCNATVISIPQWGCAHSFNVSMAANIVMWNHFKIFKNYKLNKNLF